MSNRITHMDAGGHSACCTAQQLHEPTQAFNAKLAAPLRPTPLNPTWSICATVGACVSHTARLRYAGGVTCVARCGKPADQLGAGAVNGTLRHGPSMSCAGCTEAQTHDKQGAGTAHLQRQLARHVQHRGVHLRQCNNESDVVGNSRVALDTDLQPVGGRV